jgi:hypothetical protein
MYFKIVTKSSKGLPYEISGLFPTYTEAYNALMKYCAEDDEFVPVNEMTARRCTFYNASFNLTNGQANGFTIYLANKNFYGLHLGVQAL